MSVSAGPPRLLRGPLSGPARLLAHAAALPILAVHKVREPAVAEPWTLSPGDAPPTDGRLLLIFDGGCGICLHARDVFGVLDRRHHLAFDRIARHDRGLLADIPDEERYESWHVIRPDGTQLSGAEGLLAVIAELPGGRLPAAVAGRFGGTAERGYRWFAENRGWISRGSGLINHPERDPREQLNHPGHAELLETLTVR